MMLAYDYVTVENNESKYVYVYVVAEFLCLQAEQGYEFKRPHPFMDNMPSNNESHESFDTPILQAPMLTPIASQQVPRSTAYLSTEILSGTSGLTSVTTFRRSSTTFSPDFLPASSISLTLTSASALASSSAFLFPCLCCSYNQRGILGLIKRIQSCEPRLRIS
jgi:hypothetical protein